jgi:hypothetical protein
MNVVYRLHTQVGEDNLRAGGQRMKDIEVEITLWVDGGPSYSNEVAGMQHGYRES